MVVLNINEGLVIDVVKALSDQPLEPVYRADRTDEYESDTQGGDGGDILFKNPGKGFEPRETIERIDEQDEMRCLGPNLPADFIQGLLHLGDVVLKVIRRRSHHSRDPVLALLMGSAEVVVTVRPGAEADLGTLPRFSFGGKQRTCFESDQGEEDSRLELPQILVLADIDVDGSGIAKCTEPISCHQKLSGLARAHTSDEQVRGCRS